MKKEVNRKKHEYLYINGFTLVELLATIAILGLIIGIVVYVAINAVNNAKNKSYEVTINNIENVAVEYAMENQNNISWRYTDIDNMEQYYCVNVQDLIDSGYFKSDVLDSYIAKDVLVKSDDYIYLEMNSLTKTITKNKLLLSGDNNYNSLCNNVSTVGSINFKVEPYGWTREKKIVIDYKLLNITENLSGYSYYYQYIDNNGNKTDILGNDTFDKMNISKEITVSENGIIRSQINYGDKLVTTNSLNIGKIDRNTP